MPGAGIGFVPNVTVTPLGCPLADSVIALLKPFNAVVLMVEVPLLPCCTVTDDGEALIVKFGGLEDVTVRETVVVWVIPPPVPVTVMV